MMENTDVLDWLIEQLYPMQQVEVESTGEPCQDPNCACGGTGETVIVKSVSSIVN